MKTVVRRGSLIILIAQLARFWLAVGLMLVALIPLAGLIGYLHEYLPQWLADLLTWIAIPIFWGGGWVFLLFWVVLQLSSFT